MKKILTIFLCLAVILSLSACTYNPPEGYTKKHHTYQEILEFAKTLDPDAVVSKEYTDTTIKDWNRNFREYPAVINGIDCHVSSVGDMVGNEGFAGGEFPKQFYVIDTDYDYLVLQQIINEKQPSWNMLGNDLSDIYNWNNLLGVKISTQNKKPLTNDELEQVWQQAFEIYTQYNTYSIRKEPFFSISAPAKYYNQSENKYFVKKDSLISIRGFSEQDKTDFIKKYTDAWALLESNLKIE